MTKRTNSIAHVIVNNLGGITSLIQNLILYKGDKALPQELYLLDIAGNKNTPALIEAALNPVATYFPIHPSDNWYYTYSRMAKLLSKSEGALITNDQYDLIMLEAFQVPRKVIQIAHDAYNVQLSARFHECIDLFIAHSIYIYEELKRLLPHRTQDILHLPYGIPIETNNAKEFNQSKPLQLLFLGRHDKAKGVFDLYEIHRLLQQQGIPVKWTILGRGPETERLQEQWKLEEQVRFSTPATNQEILAEAAMHDVLVFPTKFEGFPVALLEAMSMGCVPVVTDLPGGIRELVEDGQTGYKCAIDQNKVFAEKIALLHTNRELLFDMQRRSIEKVSVQYNAVLQAPKYQAAFEKIIQSPEAPRHHAVKKKIGSRLDQLWLPNTITRLARSIR